VIFFQQTHSTNLNELAEVLIQSLCIMNIYWQKPLSACLTSYITYLYALKEISLMFLHE